MLCSFHYTTCSQVDLHSEKNAVLAMPTGPTGAHLTTILVGSCRQPAQVLLPWVITDFTEGATPIPVLKHLTLLGERQKSDNDLMLLPFVFRSLAL